MKIKAVRLHGVNDLRLDEFDMPALLDSDILVKIESDSLCMSSYKAAGQGSAHKRVPDNIAEHPVIIGHEFCATIAEIGKKYGGKYEIGQRVTIQPAVNTKNSMASPGYAYEFCGGDATYAIIPEELTDAGAILPFSGEAFFHGSLAEPMSCIIGAFRAQYHTMPGRYEHKMGIVPGGKLALIASAGPMGMGAIDYAVNGPVRPGLLVVTDIDAARLERAASIYTAEAAAKNGVKLLYINTSSGDPVGELMAASGGTGYDDVFVMAPVKVVIEQADAILARDGCLNFFAGPTDTAFSAPLNFYNVHYSSTHLVGTSGGNTDDMTEALELMASGAINPAGMITHIGGLDSAAEATLNLPKTPGGKKLIYTQLQMPLTAIDDMARLGESDPLMKRLSDAVNAGGGLWNAAAEKILLEYGKRI